MTARTHDAFAFASLVTVASYFPPQSLNAYTLFASLIGNIIGGLVPDMDTAGNRLWDLMPAGNSLAKIFKRIFYKHRTITHSLVGIFLIYKILDWILVRILNPTFINPEIVLMSILIGYMSHLLADSFTEEGIPLFFPIDFNFGIPPISKIRIKTGGWFEKIVILPSIAVYLILFIGKNSQNLIQILKSVSI